nr:hypothetical protein Iba_scaffold1536CG1570 [Ipomoea batatas]
MMTTQTNATAHVGVWSSDLSEAPPPPDIIICSFSYSLILKLSAYSSIQEDHHLPQGTERVLHFWIIIKHLRRSQKCRAVVALDWAKLHCRPAFPYILFYLRLGE